MVEKKVKMKALILLEIDGFIATVTINNPKKLNALSLNSWKDLARVISALRTNKKLRCVVLRGAGNRAFAAGADISEFPEKRSNASVVNRGSNGLGELTILTVGFIAISLHFLFVAAHLVVFCNLILFLTI